MFLAFRSCQSYQLVLKFKYIKDGKLAIHFGKIQSIDNLKEGISVGVVRMGIYRVGLMGGRGVIS